ncbi:MAG: hypothetical protein E7A62_06650 [Actinomycetaceae bacterium]|nr:hypothetical protein [Actinomycetaceae bacterium]MDU0970659.1 hypothetical protein [Actinomycetaceae bacterium]
MGVDQLDVEAVPAVEDVRLNGIGPHLDIHRHRRFAVPHGVRGGLADDVGQRRRVGAGRRVADGDDVDGNVEAVLDLGDRVLDEGGE